MAGGKDLLRWPGSYWAFSIDAVRKFLFGSWLPGWLDNSQSWIEKQYPGIWLKLLSFSYQLKYSAGRKKSINRDWELKIAVPGWGKY